MKKDPRNGVFFAPNNSEGGLPAQAVLVDNKFDVEVARVDNVSVTSAKGGSMSAATQVAMYRGNTEWTGFWSVCENGKVFRLVFGKYHDGSCPHMVLKVSDHDPRHRSCSCVIRNSNLPCEVVHEARVSGWSGFETKRCTVFETETGRLCVLLNTCIRGGHNFDKLGPITQAEFI